MIWKYASYFFLADVLLIGPVYYMYKKNREADFREVRTKALSLSTIRKPERRIIN